MSRFILFRCSGLYGGVDHISDRLSAAFEAEGDHITAIPARHPNSLSVLQRAIAEGADGFIGITGIGLDRRRAQENLYNRLGWPFGSIFLDPLLLYWDQIVTPIERRMLFTTAPDDVPYCAGSVAGSPPVRHLPHGADPVPPERRPAWDRRDIDILFAGTAPPDPAALRAGWAAHGPAIEKQLNDILDAHDADPFLPLVPLIAAHAEPVARLNSPASLSPYFAALDRFLRARARWLTATALLPLPVRFVGPGWERVVAAACAPGRAGLTGPMPAARLSAMFRRARVVVNTCTPYHGSHERVFEAMAAGALALTTRTAWLRAAAPEDGLVDFRPEAADLASRVEALLAPGSAAEAIAATGTTWQAAGHSWRHRARDIKAGLALV